MSVTRDPELEKVFEIHRNYIEHEDGLINQRTTWLITVQSFLLATFGLSYQKKFEVAEKLFSRNSSLSDLGAINSEYNIFMLALAFIGLVTSIAAFFSIRAAVLALRSVRDNWLIVSKDSLAGYLPGVTGGGDKQADREGITLSLWAPVFFFFLWLAVIVFLLVWLRIQAGIR